MNAISIDRNGDLKIGTRKCKSYTKAEIVAVGNKYGVVTSGRSIPLICQSLKSKVNAVPNNLHPAALRLLEAGLKKRANETARMKNDLHTYLRMMNPSPSEHRQYMNMKKNLPNNIHPAALKLLEAGMKKRANNAAKMKKNLLNRIEKMER